MKIWKIGLVLMLIVTTLVGCGGSDSLPTEEPGDTAPADTGSSVEYTSVALDTSYERALPVSSQLALGTFQLMEMENAVTPEQAKALLPLWQAIQGGSLQSEAETNAVLKQIEGAMTADQLAAIAAMQLTFEDVGTWMQEQGLNFGPPQGAAEGQGPFGNMSEEEREAMRATAQAGGMGGFGGNMSEEEREAMRATAEASGMTFGGGRAGGAGRGQLAVMAEPLVELLTQLVGE